VVGLPRVPDGRAGMYNRAGLLGVTVNICKQCQMR
jgi:hypothetical protein